MEEKLQIQIPRKVGGTLPKILKYKKNVSSLRYVKTDPQEFGKISQTVNNTVMREFYGSEQIFEYIWMPKN